MERLHSLQKPDTLRSQVEKYLRQAIMEGRFKPGERLKERELCELLDVSRPSLREALRRLEAEKLIVTVMHRGPVVATVTADEARELYAIRALLESYAAEQFAKRATEKQIAQLGSTVKRLHQAGEKGKKDGLLEAKTQFYEVLLAGSGNALAQEMLLGMLSRVNLLRATSFSKPARLQESLREIDHLYARIKARDAAGAKKAANTHVGQRRGGGARRIVGAKQGGQARGGRLTRRAAGVPDRHGDGPIRM